MRIGSQGKGETPARGLLYAACDVRSWIIHTIISDSKDSQSNTHIINSTRRSASTALR